MPKTPENSKFLLLDENGEIDSFHDTLTEAVDYVDDYEVEDDEDITVGIYKLVREVRITKKVERTTINVK